MASGGPGSDPGRTVLEGRSVDIACFVLPNETTPPPTPESKREIDVQLLHLFVLSHSVHMVRCSFFRAHGCTI